MLVHAVSTRAYRMSIVGAHSSGPCEWRNARCLWQWQLKTAAEISDYATADRATTARCILEALTYRLGYGWIRTSDWALSRSVFYSLYSAIFIARLVRLVVRTIYNVGLWST